MRVVSIVLASGNNKRIRELSNERAVAATPVAGNYRSIDFVLSNTANSHIQDVVVSIQYNSRSLNLHLSSSKWWGFGCEQGELLIFMPSIIPEDGDWYRETANTLYQNLAFLKNGHEPYVVIAVDDDVYKLDYNRILEYHTEKETGIIVVYKDTEGGADVARFGYVKLNDDRCIMDSKGKPIANGVTTISCGIYVIRRRQLIELLERCAVEGRYNLVNGTLVRYKNLERIYTYKLSEYRDNIASVDSYYKTDVNFLRPEVRDRFLRQHPDVYTKIDDLSPAKYNPGVIVRNSLISSRCVLNEAVKNSILFKEAYVGNNCMTKNSTILDDIYIGNSAVIENCIVKSGDTVRTSTTRIGTPENIKIVMKKNKKYTL